MVCKINFFHTNSCFPENKNELSVNDKVAEIKDDDNDIENGKKEKPELDLSKILFIIKNIY